LLGPPGHEEFVTRLEALYPGLVAKRVPRHVREVATDGSALDLCAFVLRAGPAVHKQPAISLRVEAGGHVVCYSGDSDHHDGLVDLCRGADVALLDCSMPDGQGVPGHMTPGRCADVAARAGVRTLVLTHLYPACDGVDVAAQARAAFAGEIRVATDGMRIDL
jgi:ribonuclease BN (tRNA processing enzyme)